MGRSYQPSRRVRRRVTNASPTRTSTRLSTTTSASPPIEIEEFDLWLLGTVGAGGGGRAGGAYGAVAKACWKVASTRAWVSRAPAPVSMPVPTESAPQQLSSQHQHEATLRFDPFGIPVKSFVRMNLIRHFDQTSFGEGVPPNPEWIGWYGPYL